MAGKNKHSIFDLPITKGAQRDLDETLRIKSLSESAIEDLSASQSIFPSAYSQTPLPPDPLFATLHGCRKCPLTSEEDQKLTNNLISIASKFDSTGILKLTEAENYTDWAQIYASVSVAATAFSRPPNTRTSCEHCNHLNHPSAKYWTKFPHLKPKRPPRDTAVLPSDDNKKMTEHTNATTHVKEATATIVSTPLDYDDVEYWSAVSLTDANYCSVD
ncbi:hypothetical protein EW146_g8662 [Bondarzewia mesenterica]|uniref:Uncharacterized protein n=1 Tax=Bondarzewia mesenterica TaxID=1095465 RepID=A0A4S4LEC9_9AGAM|nr:hypothetical protein EW146_g8662 [Bondarzewia mesenterica]